MRRGIQGTLERQQMSITHLAYGYYNSVVWFTAECLSIVASFYVPILPYSSVVFSEESDIVDIISKSPGLRAVAIQLKMVIVIPTKEKRLLERGLSESIKGTTGALLPSLIAKNMTFVFHSSADKHTD